MRKTLFAPSRLCIFVLISFALLKWRNRSGAGVAVCAPLRIRGGVGGGVALALMSFALLSTVIVSAQEVPDRVHPRQVFVDRDASPDGSDRIIFVDLLTGEQRETLILGDRYTLLANALLYWDTAQNQVMLLSPDLSARPHPFIQLPPGARRVDWLLSPDQQRIAWTITSGSPEALSTQTFLADIDGANQRDVFTDGAHASIRAFPVAFDVNGTILYMDYQPDAIGDFAPMRQYAGLFAVDLATGTAEQLPGEPGCFCGASIGAGRFVRLTLADGLSGFNVRLIELASGSEWIIPSLNLTGFTQGGDVTIAPDGAQAIYTLAQVRGFGTDQQSVQTVFVLVDLINRTQRILTEPANSWFRPVAWTEDSRALLVTSPTLDGTWKIDVTDGSLRLIADANYLGSLIPAVVIP